MVSCFITPTSLKTLGIAKAEGKGKFTTGLVLILDNLAHEKGVSDCHGKNVKKMGIHVNLPSGSVFGINGTLKDKLRVLR